jgi:hypothetical protein
MASGMGVVGYDQLLAFPVTETSNTYYSAG